MYMLVNVQLLVQMVVDIQLLSGVNVTSLPGVKKSSLPGLEKKNLFLGDTPHSKKN